MLVYRTIEEKVFWEFDSIIMQNMCHNLLLFCTQTWPSLHVTKNHLLKFKRPGSGEGSWYGFVTRRYPGDMYTGKHNFPIFRKPKKVDSKVDKGIAKLKEKNKEKG